MSSTPRRRGFAVLIALLSALAVSVGGCGKKGPLFLPDDAPKPPASVFPVQ